MSEHFGSLALPVGEFLALEHGTEYHGCGHSDRDVIEPQREAYGVLVHRSCAEDTVVVVKLTECIDTRSARRPCDLQGYALAFLGTRSTATAATALWRRRPALCGPRTASSAGRCRARRSVSTSSAATPRRRSAVSMLAVSDLTVERTGQVSSPGPFGVLSS